VHLFGANTRAHGLISETVMPPAKLNALTILGAVDEARSDLVGKAIVLTDGKAGTVENVLLDELHGLRISSGHPWRFNDPRVASSAAAGTEQNRTQPIVVRLAGRESEMDRQAIGVYDRVNFARQSPRERPVFW
jgi:hypothetical protein